MDPSNLALFSTPLPITRQSLSSTTNSPTPSRLEYSIVGNPELTPAHLKSSYGVPSTGILEYLKERGGKVKELQEHLEFQKSRCDSLTQDINDRDLEILDLKEQLKSATAEIRTIKAAAAAAMLKPPDLVSVSTLDVPKRLKTLLDFEIQRGLDLEAEMISLKKSEATAHTKVQELKSEIQEARLSATRQHHQLSAELHALRDESARRELEYLERIRYLELDLKLEAVRSSSAGAAVLDLQRKLQEEVARNAAMRSEKRDGLEREGKEGEVMKGKGKKDEIKEENGKERDQLENKMKGEIEMLRMRLKIVKEALGEKDRKMLNLQNRIESLEVEKATSKGGKEGEEREKRIGVAMTGKENDVTPPSSSLSTAAVSDVSASGDDKNANNNNDICKSTYNHRDDHNGATTNNNNNNSENDHVNGQTLPPSSVPHPNPTLSHAAGDPTISPHASFPPRHHSGNRHLLLALATVVGNLNRRLSDLIRRLTDRIPVTYRPDLTDSVGSLTLWERTASRLIEQLQLQQQRQEKEGEEEKKGEEGKEGEEQHEEKQHEQEQSQKQKQSNPNHSSKPASKPVDMTKPSTTPTVTLPSSPAVSWSLSSDLGMERFLEAFLTPAAAATEAACECTASVLARSLAALCEDLDSVQKTVRQGVEDAARNEALRKAVAARVERLEKAVGEERGKAEAAEIRAKVAEGQLAVVTEDRESLKRVLFTAGVLDADLTTGEASGEASQSSRGSGTNGNSNSNSNSNSSNSKSAINNNNSNINANPDASNRDSLLKQPAMMFSLLCPPRLGDSKTASGKKDDNRVSMTNPPNGNNDLNTPLGKKSSGIQAVPGTSGMSHTGHQKIHTVVPPQQPPLASVPSAAAAVSITTAAAAAAAAAAIVTTPSAVISTPVPTTLRRTFQERLSYNQHAVLAEGLRRTVESLEAKLLASEAKVVDLESEIQRHKHLVAAAVSARAIAEARATTLEKEADNLASEVAVLHEKLGRGEIARIGGMRVLHYKYNPEAVYKKDAAAE
eukprot:CAMPEP_0175043802 /NCGR_PEP_ID=MMETSP0052_2-20121109/3410_1 /TAXON_ID=51329 ORGANISM="Polytomella parva, Strain SAG 63-3" /NCGR_SAMPLE_ID=MMETSP0052_2 /ASSEMBLY_ACC=CAM_ASM_000194 /LENGTH=1016 /DNA_ID=CAMNT_0016306943 /DNA_START=90 /DNA_END=3137 /DNA_ORIENTATION=-